MFKKVSLTVLFSSLIGLGLVVAFIPRTTGAVTAADWRADNIIDDYVFTDVGSMSVSQIQNFLNNRVGTGTNGVPGQCDTNGVRTSELGGGTRAQYGVANNNPAPFTCLKDFYEVPKTTPGLSVPANNYGGKSIPTGAKSAAQLIWDAAQQYNISPKVLLVKLGTESAGPLTSDDWPFLKQYTYAMGAHCPDSGPNGSANCNPDYSGFSIQMSEAAAMLRGYLDNMDQTWWPYKRPGPGVTLSGGSNSNYVGWNVAQSGCGGSVINIANRATAALYTYTPYQPNQVALNNMYGLGDSCSAYGNRNFWRVYNDWFGSTQPNLSISSALRINSVPQGAFTGVPTTVSFDLVNNTNTSITQNLAIFVRDSGGGNHDYHLMAITIPAHGTATYSDTRTFTVEDNYTFGVTSLSNGVWNENYPTSSIVYNPRSLTINIQTMPTITVAPASDTSDMRVGRAANLSFTVKNNSAKSLDIGKIALAVRDPNGLNVDRALDNTGAIAPGAQYVYTKSFTPLNAGVYKGFVTETNDNGQTWNETNFPASATGIQRSIQFTVKPSPTITASLQSSITNPHVGQTATLTFKVKNYGSSSVNLDSIGIAGRNSSGGNIDPGVVSISLAAGEERTVSLNTNFKSTGINTYSIISTSDFRLWGAGPSAEDGTINKTLRLTVLPNPTLTQGPALDISFPRVGQLTSMTFKVKNYSVDSADIGYLGLAIRDPYGRNVDAGGVNLNVNANTEYVFQAHPIFLTSGVYTAWITSYRNGVWDDIIFPTTDSSAVTRKIQFNVKPSPTVTTSIQSSNATPHVGQTATLAFNVKNYGSSSINLGYIGLAGRDPSGRNVDPGVIPTTLSAGQEQTISFDTSFTSAGNYKYYIISTNDFMAWLTGPTAEDGTISKSLSLTVLP